MFKMKILYYSIVYKASLCSISLFLCNILRYSNVSIALLHYRVLQKLGKSGPCRINFLCLEISEGILYFDL